MCDPSSIVAAATRLVVGASGTALDGGVFFPGEFSIIAGAFALGQVLNFGRLSYVTTATMSFVCSTGLHY
jgi:hypothetical protein